MPLDFGTGRIGAGWVGICIAAAAFVPIATAQFAAGAPVVLLAVGPVLGAFALICATVRTVRIEPEAGTVAVTRRLLGLSWTRRWRLERFRAVVVTMSINVPRRHISDGTLLGNLRYASYDLWLKGRGRIWLTYLHGSPPEAPADAADALARGLAARLGLVAERHGYAREAVAEFGGRVLSVPRRRHIEPIIG